jgi:plasmid stability protein
MESAVIKQMTLRRIPDAVEKGLRMRSVRTGRSLNRVTIELLEQALGAQDTVTRKRDLSGLAGKWSRQEGEAFERNVRVFEKIDEELWKK